MPGVGGTSQGKAMPAAPPLSDGQTHKGGDGNNDPDHIETVQSTSHAELLSGRTGDIEFLFSKSCACFRRTPQPYVLSTSAAIEEAIASGDMVAAYPLLAKLLQRREINFTGGTPTVHGSGAAYRATREDAKGGNWRDDRWVSSQKNPARHSRLMTGGEEEYAERFGRILQEGLN